MSKKPKVLGKWQIMRPSKKRLITKKPKLKIMSEDVKHQTAVEWLHIEFQKIFPKETKEMYNNNQFSYENMIEQAKQMEKEQNNAKIQNAIEKFEEAKSKASSLKDMVYLDGVLAILDTIKNETFKSE